MDENTQKGSDGSVQISVNDEKVMSDGETLGEEEAKRMVENINQGLNTIMNDLNKSLKEIMNGINMEQLNNRISNVNPAKLVRQITGANLMDQIKQSNLTNSLPSIETVNEDGKFQLLVNQKKVIELDLSSLKREE